MRETNSDVTSAVKWPLRSSSCYLQMNVCVCGRVLQDELLPFEGHGVIARSACMPCRYGSIEDLRALQEIQEELVEAGLMQASSDAALAAKARVKASKAKRNSARASPGGEGSKFRRFTTPSGMQVLVGRNNHQNDELSMKVANGMCI